MAKNKTVETKNNVSVFLKAVKDEKKRKDCSAIIQLFTDHTGLEAKMWGPAIIGFGTYHYKYESGREGDAPLVAFSPRATAIVLYLSANFEKRDELLGKRSKHKTGKGYIYLQKLEDIDTGILAKMIKGSFQHTREKYLE